MMMMSVMVMSVLNFWCEFVWLLLFIVVWWVVFEVVCFCMFILCFVWWLWFLILWDDVMCVWVCCWCEWYGWWSEWVLRWSLCVIYVLFGVDVVEWCGDVLMWDLIINDFKWWMELLWLFWWCGCWFVCEFIFVLMSFYVLKSNNGLLF